MSDSVDDEKQPSDEEIVRRRDEALLRALRTPPKPHSKMKLGKPPIEGDSRATAKKRGPSA